VINSLDLTLRFLKVSFECFGKLGIGGGARQSRQSLCDLFLGAVYVGQLMYEQIFNGSTGHDFTSVS
jgi:hypothetical protein